MRCWPVDPNPNLEEQCIWVLSFDLSGKGGPTSNYANANIALRIIVPRKLPYRAKDAFVKVELPQEGGRPKKNWMEGIKKTMNERNLNEGQWEDRKRWSLGVGQRRKTF
jgi:hypothetical protein